MINFMFWLIFIQLGVFFVVSFILAMSFFLEWRAERVPVISKRNRSFKIWDN